MSSRSIGRILLVACAAVTGFGPGILAGQAATGGSDVPAWLTRWRPLDTTGDLPRSLPGTRHVFADLLTRPAPRVGTFWTVGNPAALPLQVDDTRADFSVGLSDDSGDYRRPLDPGSRAGGALTGTGWQPLGDRGAAIGRIEVRRTSLTDGAFSDVLVPYGSSPFFALDTLGDDQNRTLARIEGAGGWRVGDFAVGLGFGYESQDTRTKESNVPRLNRTATPGATAGVAWSSQDGRVTVAAYGRWQQTAQSFSVFSIGAPSRAYAPDGFTEPVAFNLNSGIFRRRYERTAWAGGASIQRSLGASTVVLYGQRESLSEDRFSPRTNDPLTDTWDTSGWTAGAAAALPLGRLSLTLGGRFTTLTGNGVRGDIELMNFTSDDRLLALDGDLRWAPGDRWELAGGVNLRRETHDRADLIEQAAFDLSSWSTTGRLEIARQFSDRVALALGGSISGYNPSSATPDASPIGPAYQKWIAPELGLLATGASGWAGQATIRIAANERTGVWMRGQYGSASPETLARPLSDSPAGDRDHWSVVVGVTLDGS